MCENNYLNQFDFVEFDLNGENEQNIGTSQELFSPIKKMNETLVKLQSKRNLQSDLLYLMNDLSIDDENPLNSSVLSTTPTNQNIAIETKTSEDDIALKTPVIKDQNLSYLQKMSEEQSMDLDSYPRLATLFNIFHSFCSFFPH